MNILQPSGLDVSSGALRIHYVLLSDLPVYERSWLSCVITSEQIMPRYFIIQLAVISKGADIHLCTPLETKHLSQEPKMRLGMGMQIHMGDRRPWSWCVLWRWCLLPCVVTHGLPWWLSNKDSACSAGDPGERGWSLDQEDPLEEGMATHSSALAWRIPWTEEPGWLESVGLQRVGHDWRGKEQVHTL